jgi:phosphate uptake regulator
MQAVNDENLTDEKKLEIFNKSFNSMSDITLGLLVDSITAIKTPEVVVEDRKFIKEFLENADKSIYQTIQDHITKMKKATGIKPLKITATPEQIAAGAPETYELPISLDNSDFFGLGS